MKTYLLFIIKAYNIAEGGNEISDSVVIELIDKNPELALDRAKALIKRTNYQITDIFEKIDK
jgi:hypothetical protein